MYQSKIGRLKRHNMLSLNSRRYYARRSTTMTSIAEHLSFTSHFQYKIIETVYSSSSSNRSTCASSSIGTVRYPPRVRPPLLLKKGIRVDASFSKAIPARPRMNQGTEARVATIPESWEYEGRALSEPGRRIALQKRLE